LLGLLLRRPAEFWPDQADDSRAEAVEVASVFVPLLDPLRAQALVGMTAERLGQGERQPGLFSDPQKDRQRKLEAVADPINERFGKRAIHRGGASGGLP
jgi:hypothetical protein